jgi:hypothetical protein
MYKVKFTPYRKSLGDIMLRQTKGGKGISSDGRYQFYINEDINDPDFWVVQGKGVRSTESTFVAPENTILVTTEPESVLVYPKKYTKQFGMVHSSQEQIKHPNLILGPIMIPWYVGFKQTKDKGFEVTLTYDDFFNSKTPKKTKLISVITSNKAFTKGHQDRIDFVEKLKAHYGDKIDVFGRGYNDFDDKWDVLAPYKYHIAIENDSSNYYWTEKISDCYLTETFPIYHGCTKLSDYFPDTAFQSIDILDFESAVKIIDRIIKEDTFEKHKAVLKECKLKVLNEYNLFDYIAMLCDKLDSKSPKKEVVIKPCRSIDDWHNLYNYLIKFSLFKLKKKVKELVKGKSVLHKN